MNIRTELEIRNKLHELREHKRDNEPADFVDRDDEQEFACLDAQIHALEWALGIETELCIGTPAEYM
jgi:hypothetical protein